MSAEGLNDVALAQAYEVDPAIALKPGIMPALREIDTAVQQMPGALQSITQEAPDLLQARFNSPEAKQHMAEVHKDKLADLAKPDSRFKSAGALARRAYLFLKKKTHSAITAAKAAFKENVVDLCTDAYYLLRDNVGSIVKDTAKTLLSGSALSRVGAVLSFPGKIFEGMSVFWDKLVQKRPTLKTFDTYIVTPLATLLYVKMWPALMTIKSCEFIGRSMEAVDKTGRWTSIVGVARDMLVESGRHAMRIIVPGSKLVKEAIGVVKTLDGSAEKENIDNSIKFGIRVALGPSTSDNKAKEARFHLLSGENALQQINVKGLVEKVPALEQVFADKSDKTPQGDKTFKEVVGYIVASTIEPKEKYQLVADVTTHIVKIREQETAVAKAKAREGTVIEAVTKAASAVKSFFWRDKFQSKKLTPEQKTTKQPTAISQLTKGS